jgi:RNA polymerase sigma-70 factor (ECF subfamily)
MVVTAIPVPVVAMAGEQGLTEPFEAAFRPLFMRAFRLAHRMLGDKEAAEDVAAEALARAHMHWSHIAGLDHRDAWVLRVTANLAVDAIRRRRPPVLPADAVDFEDQAALRLALAAALRALPRRQREVIALRYLAGLNEGEVAAALGISPGSVRTHIHRGLTALRARLDPRFPEVSVDAD